MMFEIPRRSSHVALHRRRHNYCDTGQMFSYISYTDVASVITCVDVFEMHTVDGASKTFIE